METVDDFLELGKMNVKGHYETVEENKWPMKPFYLMKCRYKRTIDR